MSAPNLDVHPAARARPGLTGDARAVLERRVYAVLLTENADGSPHAAPVMFLFDGARIVVETGAATRKARNVAARGRAGVLVQTPEAAWVLGRGPATVVTGAQVADLRGAIRDKYLSAAGRRACDDLLDEMDDAVIVVTPGEWLAWDIGGFIEAAAERGADPAEAESWFVPDEPQPSDDLATLA